jgi:uncharacterized protein YjeT (DUF2065 family)
MTILNATSFKSPIKTITISEGHIVRSSSKGESCEYKKVEEQLKYQDRTEVIHVLESAHDVAEFERRSEYLKDLLIENCTALSEQEMLLLKTIFNSNKQLIDLDKETAPMLLVSLAGLLEPLIENNAYAQDITTIVRSLLKSPAKSLRYAGLDIIAAGLGIVPVADSLLKEAKILLKNEESGYVLEYLESL